MSAIIICLFRETIHEKNKNPLHRPLRQRGEALCEVILYIFNVRLAEVYAVGVILVPVVFFLQALFERYRVRQKLTLAANVERIFVFVEWEEFALRNVFVNAYKLRLLSCRIVAKLHPFSDRDKLLVSDVENALTRVLFKEYFNKAAEVGDVKKLHFHAAVAGNVERSVLNRAVERESLTVYVVVNSVQVGRTENVSARHFSLRKRSALTLFSP